MLFTSKIRDREEGIVIYSFYTWFSFLTWVWVNIFLEIVSSKTATTHIFQSGVRNWPAGVRSKISTCRRELAPCLAGKGGARQESENRSRKEILKRQIEVRYKESRTANLGLELKNKIFFSPPLFVCLPSPKRFWRKSCNFRALFLSSFVIGSQISQFQGSGCTRKEAFSTWLLTVYLISYMGCSLLSTF